MRHGGGRMHAVACAWQARAACCWRQQKRGSGTEAEAHGMCVCVGGVGRLPWPPPPIFHERHVSPSHVERDMTAFRLLPPHPPPSPPFSHLPSASDLGVKKPCPPCGWPFLNSLPLLEDPQARLYGPINTLQGLFNGEGVVIHLPFPHWGLCCRPWSPIDVSFFEAIRFPVAGLEACCVKRFSSWSLPTSAVLLGVGGRMVAWCHKGELLAVR